VATPADKPLTIPESEPTPAINGAVDVQVPPVGNEENVEELPKQIFTAPDGVIADGAGLIVTVAVAKQVPKK
jgi:hypothetical protein